MTVTNDPDYYESGTDLSLATDITCFICGVTVANEHYNLHVSWHSTTSAPIPAGYYDYRSNQFGIYPGTPMEDAINKLSDAIGNLQNEVGLLRSKYPLY